MFRKILTEFDAYIEDKIWKEKNLKMEKKLLEVLSEISSGDKFNEKLFRKAKWQKVKNSKPRTSSVKILESESKIKFEKEFENMKVLGSFNQASFKTGKRFFVYENEKKCILELLGKATVTVKRSLQ
jgi:hypothetical protein